MEEEGLLETLTWLHEAGRVMGSTLDSAETGDRLLQILDRTLGLTASVIRLHDGEGSLRVLTSWNLESSPADVWSGRIEPARQRALEEGKQSSLQIKEGLAGVFVPLRTRSGTIGLLEAYGAPLDRAGGEFLSSLCAQAAIALDNSRLYGRILEQEQRLQELVGRMVRTQEDERRRVAHEVHDGLTQTIIAINHHLEAFSTDFAPQEPEGRERLDRISQLAQDAIEESQRVTFGLRPTVLEDFGLTAAIRSEIQSLSAQGFRVSYVDDLGESRLPEVVETTLYRIAQEALTNVRKHAGVESAWIWLERRGEEVRLRISDRGAGFDPEEATHTAGLGLVGMRERAEMIGGSLELESRAGHGTEINVAAPLLTGEEGARG